MRGGAGQLCGSGRQAVAQWIVRRAATRWLEAASGGVVASGNRGLGAQRRGGFWWWDWTSHAMARGGDGRRRRARGRLEREIESGGD